MLFESFLRFKNKWQNKQKNKFLKKYELVFNTFQLLFNKNFEKLFF